jgi:hypothetical protein
VQEPDPNYGPVITLNAYIPMAKYEIEKDITEEDVRSICVQIAADLTALLQRNPAALARAKETLNPLSTMEQFEVYGGEEGGSRFALRARRF